MSDQSMPFPSIGRIEISNVVRLRIDDSWIDAEVELGTSDVIWGDNEINLTGRADIKELEISFKFAADVTDYLSQVLIEHNPEVEGVRTIDSQIGFLVRWINRSLRQRKAKKSLTLGLETRGTGRSKRTFLVGECNDIRLSIPEVPGRILFEPVIYAKSNLRIQKGATWEGGPSHVAKGAMIGWAYPLEVILDRRTGQLGSIFKFVWEHFGEVDGANNQSIFRVEWSSEPTIYLNRNVEELELVLTNRANTGRTAAVRDSLNATIALEALSVAAIAALRESEGLFHERDLSGEQVLAELSSQNRLFFESFGFLFLPDLPTSFKAAEVIDFLQTAEFDATRFVTDELPTRIQQISMTANKSTKLLQLLSQGGRASE